MTVNYFENCNFIGKCSILWQTEAFLCYCRKENYNSSGLTLAEEGMGGIRLAILAILMWRVGQGLSSQDRRPLEGTKGENCDILLSLSLLPAVSCNCAFPASRSCVFNVQRYCSDKWDALNVHKSCRNDVVFNLVV